MSNNFVNFVEGTWFRFFDSNLDSNYGICKKIDDNYLYSVKQGKCIYCDKLPVQDNSQDNQKTLLKVEKVYKVSVKNDQIIYFKNIPVNYEFSFINDDFNEIYGRCVKTSPSEFWSSKKNRNVLIFTSGISSAECMSVECTHVTFKKEKADTNETATNKDLVNTEKTKTENTKTITIPTKMYHPYDLLGENCIDEFDVVGYEILYKLKHGSTTWSGITKENCEKYNIYLTREEAEKALNDFQD